MKTKSLFVLVLTLSTLIAGAQGTLKIGYADVDYIFAQLPEAKQVESSLQNHQKQLQSQLQAKYEEYQTKMTAFQNLPADTPEAIQRDRMNELAQLEQSITQFQQSAQESMENKRVSLLEPIYEKVGNAIQAVSEEAGYDFVLTAGVGGSDIVLFAKEEYDISDVILQKLGITPPAGN